MSIRTSCFSTKHRGLRVAAPASDARPGDAASARPCFADATGRPARVPATPRRHVIAPQDH